MRTIKEVLEKIEIGINQFLAVCINANRDLPFHDKNIADTTVDGMYVVGENNMEGHGDQKKHFVSKSTLLFCTFPTAVHFNSKNNVFIPLFANTYYEFKSNIHSIFWVSTEEQESYLYIWVEGVMYNEARRPE